MSMSSQVGIRWAARAAALLALAMIPSWSGVRAQSQGPWDFIPTAPEYQAWPEYCRVQYTLFGEVASVPGGVQYPSSTVESWRRQIGPSFQGLHHFCAAIHFLTRSRAASDPKQQQFLLNRALSDSNFSLTRADTGSPVYPDMAITASQIKLDQNAGEEAISILKKAIAVQPARIETYIALSVAQRKLGNVKQARDTLVDADRIAKGESLDVQYNLGLLNLDLGDKTAATENAKKVYGQGYPLPGLRRRLEREGIRIDAGNL